MRLSVFQRFGQRTFAMQAYMNIHASVTSSHSLQTSSKRFFNAPGAGAPSSGVASPSADRVWELWSEGNLFALSISELQAFLREQGVPHIDPTWRKSTLVKQVEEIVSSLRSHSSKSVKSTEVARATPSAITASDSLSELTADGVFDQGSTFVDVQQSGLYSGDSMGPIIPRAFQLMHESLSPDVALSRINTSLFPGGSSKLQAYTLLPTNAANSNRGRFSKAFQWCVLNLWNMSMDGEMHLSVGRMLFWKGAYCYPEPAEGEQRRLMSLWTVQQKLQAQQPYTWVSVASKRNRAAVDEFLQQNAYERCGPSEDPIESYRVAVKRANREVLEGEVSSDMATTSLKPCWERFLLTFYVRDAMPDVRIQIRARLPLKKKTGDMFSGVNLIKMSGEAVEPALPGDLGEVLHVTKRSVKTWKRTIDNLRVSLLISEITSQVAYAGEGKQTEDTRMEYEMRCTIPQQNDTIDLAAISEEIWEATLQFSKALEEGMVDFGCMPEQTAE